MKALNQNAPLKWMALVNLVPVVALSDQIVTSVRILLVAVVVISRVIMLVLALATALWAKNQLLKKATAHVLVVLTTAIKSARTMARAQHVALATGLLSQTVQLAMMHRIVNILAAATNLLAIANRAKVQMR